MPNPVLERIKDSITDGGWWQSSIADAAEDFLATVDEEIVNVAVIGDIDYTNVRVIARHIDSLIRYLENKERYRLIMGDRSGVETIVARICKRNDIPYHVVPMRETADANERKAVSKELDTYLTDHCVGLMAITRGQNKTVNRAFEHARSTGRVVTKRIVGVNK